METIPDKKSEEEPQEKKGQIPPELERVMAIKIAEEKARLGGNTGEKKDNKPGWRSQAMKVLIGLTVLASVMAGIAKEAKAGEASEYVRQVINRGIDESFSTARDQRQRELNRGDELFRARLDVERQAIQQQRDDRNQVRQLSIEQVRQEIQQINNRISTYEQVKAGAIQKLSDPKADAAAIERQVRLCEGEITKLEQKRAAYLGAATGIAPAQAPSQAPEREYRPVHPASPSPPQGTFIRRENMPPQTPPPPQVRPSRGYSSPPPASRGEWRPPPQTPPPPPMQPRQNRPVSPPLSYDGKPLPPLPDL